MTRKPFFTKPYKVQLQVDNKKLIQRVGEQTSIHIHDHARPTYSGEIVYQRNPFWITLAGGSEFALMRLARLEYPKGQVLEIKVHSYGRYKS